MRKLTIVATLGLVLGAEPAVAQTWWASIQEGASCFPIKDYLHVDTPDALVAQVSASAGPGGQVWLEPYGKSLLLREFLSAQQGGPRAITLYYLYRTEDDCTNTVAD